MGSQGSLLLGECRSAGGWIMIINGVEIRFSERDGAAVWLWLLLELIFEIIATDANKKNQTFMSDRA